MILNTDLVKLFQQAYNEKWGYIWGKCGQVWTEAEQKKATREQTIKWGARWIGRKVSDCSGLFYWAFKQLGGYIYHGSNTMFNKYTSATGKLKGGKRTDGKELSAGTAVFMYSADQNSRYHVGLYIGNGEVIEAKGTYYGVIKSNVKSWDEWGELKNVIHGGVIPVSYPTIRKGASGEYVTKLQTILKEKGYSLSVDGKFGTGTETAVKQYQAANGLTADGIVGAKTWAKLTENQDISKDAITITLTRETAQTWLKAAQSIEETISKAG